MREGTRVTHITLGSATVQPLFEEFHPYHKSIGLCFVKLDIKPERFSTDVVEVFEDDLTVVKEM